MHHTATQHASTFCYGSRRVPTLHTVDTTHSNPPPLEIRVLKWRAQPKSLYQLAFTQPYTQGSTGEGQTESERILWKGVWRTITSSQFMDNVRGSFEGFNQLLQEAFQIENPLFIVISWLIQDTHLLSLRSLRYPSPCPQIISPLLPRNSLAWRAVTASSWYCLIKLMKCIAFLELASICTFPNASSSSILSST